MRYLPLLIIASMLVLTGCPQPDSAVEKVQPAASESQQGEPRLKEAAKEEPAAEVEEEAEADELDPAASTDAGAGDAAGAKTADPASPPEPAARKKVRRKRKAKRSNSESEKREARTLLREDSDSEVVRLPPADKTGRDDEADDEKSKADPKKKSEDEEGSLKLFDAPLGNDD